MKTIAVVGKNFGDEGKGLAVDYLSLNAERPLIVRHNGGAQSGHTVEIKNFGSGGERFVFHELSSGSFRSADTLWSNSFYPDMFKLGEEAEGFRAKFGFVPNIYAMHDTCITLPDDVLLNMALESSRGAQRHGSCGMGINECDLRTNAGYGLPLGAVSQMDAAALYRKLRFIREKYVSQRLNEIGRYLIDAASEYMQLLSNENVLKNAARMIADNLRYVKVLTEGELQEVLKRYGTLIFESGQGLLLDRSHQKYAPHVTASDTGLDNPCAFLDRIGYALDEAVYVSRTYVTRHGAGLLPCECSEKELGRIQRDQTNQPNEWQGHFRYARHESVNAFVADVKKDLRKQIRKTPKVSLFLTHLNETNHCVMLQEQGIPIGEFINTQAIRDTFDTFYLSDTRFSEDVRVIKAGS